MLLCRNEDDRFTFKTWIELGTDCKQILAAKAMPLFQAVRMISCSVIEHNQNPQGRSIQILLTWDVVGFFGIWLGLIDRIQSLFVKTSVASVADCLQKRASWSVKLCPVHYYKFSASVSVIIPSIPSQDKPWSHSLSVKIFWGCHGAKSLEPALSLWSQHVEFCAWQRQYLVLQSWLSHV